MATRFWGTLQWPAIAAPRVPERLPDLRRPLADRLRGYSGSPALLLAIAGPVVGIWYRFTTPAENSALMLGSRAGLVLSQDDLDARPLPGRLRSHGGRHRAGRQDRRDRRPAALEGRPARPRPSKGRNHPTDTDYALFAPILQGSEPIDLNLTLRSPHGRNARLQGPTGEQHIEQAAKSRGLSPSLLRVVDLFHVLTYPFLLFAAWLLHRRKREDLISSVLSLAVLLTIASEQPSATFLSYVAHIPVSCTGTSTTSATSACSPASCCSRSASCVRASWCRSCACCRCSSSCTATSTGELRHLHGRRRPDAARAPPAHAAERRRQQIRWALFGFTGYAMFLSIALDCDMTKLTVGSFGASCRSRCSRA